jgi:hypothetical protein
VIDGILKGDILDTFDRFYADDIVMSENGVDERVGKAGPAVRTRRRSWGP